MCASQLIVLGVMIVPMIIACAMMILGPPQGPVRRGSGRDIWSLGASKRPRRRGYHRGIW